MITDNSIPNIVPEVIEVGDIPEFLLPKAGEDLPPEIPNNLEMRYWKDDDGLVYAYPEAPQYCGPMKAGLTPMSEVEVLAHLNPLPLPWTDGVELRYVVGVMDLPGWRCATEQELPGLLVSQRTADAQARIAKLRREADAAIAPLQDAIDLQEASEFEIEQLNTWKRYRIALSRLTERSGYPENIDWPVPPA
ncbi:tail fiber assembly protein [Pseudomonas wadenswilerensis]